MSLINQALQRAREEAVRQEAAKKGVPLPPPPRLKEKSSWQTLAVLVLAIALAVSVVALLGLAKRLPSAVSEPSLLITPEAHADGSGLVASTPDRSGLGGSDEVAGSAHRTPATKVSQETVADEASLRSPPTDGETPAEFIEDSAGPVELAAVDTIPAPTSNSAYDDSLESKESGETLPMVDLSPGIESYIRHIELGDGVSIELGGIAWSESGPYALLNGRVVGIGESVTGYFVREIDPLQVVLEGVDRQFVLRLK